MINAPNRLDIAKANLDEKRKKLAAAHLVSISAVNSESRAKRDLIDAYDLVRQAMEAMTELTVSTAATKVIEQAALAAQAVKRATEVAGHGKALETLAVARDLALKTLEDARKVALETLDVAKQVALDFAHEKSARDFEVDSMTLRAPGAAPPVRR